MLAKFEQKVSFIKHVLGNFTAVVFLLMLFIVFINVMLRYVFDTGLVALQEAEWHLFSVMFLFGTFHHHLKRKLSI